MILTDSVEFYDLDDYTSKTLMHGSISGVLKPVQKQRPSLQKAKSVICIGNFDGLHLGHQNLINYAKQIAKDQKSLLGLLSFTPHTKLFFSKCEQRPFLLSNDITKLMLAKQSKVDWVGLIKFDQTMADLSPNDFIQSILQQNTQINSIVVGDGFRFGYQRRGTIATLHDANIDVHHIALSKQKETVISSTNIRKAIAHGDMHEAKLYLGRPYQVTGNVVIGDQIGTKLGFPTANVDIGMYMRPGDGIYCARVRLANKMDKVQEGILYCGTRPAFNGFEERFEVHLFNFDRELYGECMEVNIDMQIRGDKNFSTTEALQKQMHKDCQIAMNYYLQ